MKYIYTVFIILTSFNLISQVNIGYGVAGDGKYLKPTKASYVDSEVEWIIDDNESRIYCKFSNPIYYPFKDMYWNIDSVKSYSEFDMYQVSTINNSKFTIYFYKEQHGMVVFDRSNDTFTAMIGDDLEYKIKN